MTDSKKTVLVAEDNRVLSDVMSFNLQRAGFQVVVARDGVKAMQHLRTETFDLLITDFQMPGANGEELCRFVREELRLDELPILMCSAKGLELDTARLAAQWNVSKTIHKPFSMREIVALVQALINPNPAFAT